MNTLLDIRYNAYGLLGSFWAEKMKGTSLRRSRALSALARRANCFESLVAGMRNLAGERGYLQSATEIPFQPRQVVTIGADIQKRVRVSAADSSTLISYLRRPSAEEYVFPQTNYTLLQLEDPDAVGVVVATTEGDEYLLLPANGEPNIDVNPTQDDWLPKYLLPIPVDMIPLKIRRMDGREMLSGIDYEVGVGVLIFTENPLEIFPSSRVHIVSAFMEQNHLFDFTLGIDPVQGSVSEIARYVRDCQTASVFLRATAQACGFELAPWTSAVADVTTDGHSKFYEFPEGVIRISYPHRALASGDTVTIGDVIGAPISILGPRQTGDRGWWRQLDWSAGLSLDGLTPFKGLTVPDSSARAFVQATGPDDYHARIELQGDATTQDRFWYSVKRNELLTGKYLNEVIGLTASDDYQFVNPLDVLFDYLFAERAWIITRRNFRDWDHSRRARFEQFTSREKPFSGILLTTDILE